MTGCRIKDEDDKNSADAATFGIERVKWQACDYPKKWPFQSVASHAAQSKPALVVHVGDFLYRESREIGLGASAPCRGGKPGASARAVDRRGRLCTSCGFEVCDFYLLCKQSASFAIYK